MTETKPTIEEQIARQEYRVKAAKARGSQKEEIVEAAILASLRKLAAIKSQPVPVEPDEVKWLRKNTRSSEILKREEVYLKYINVLQSALQVAQQEIHVVFDGPPSNESGRFVEVENAEGKSVEVGRWEQRGNYWHLILGGEK